MNRTLSTLLVALAALAPLLAACGEEGPSAASADQVTTEHHVSAGSEHGQHAGHASEPEHGHHGAHPSALPAGELPGTSLFHLASAWTDQDGGDFALPEMRGKASVFVMFYGDCTTACPLLVRSAEEIEAALPAELQGQVEFVMVTFATEEDTPAKLKAYAASKGLDREGWRWLVGSPLQTRQLATLLGVQYRDVGNGMYAHSNVVTILDREGVPLARLEGLGIDLGPAVKALVAAAG